MKKIMMIYNPASGDGSINNKIDDIVMLHQDEGFELILREIRPDLNLEAILKEIDEDFSHIMVAGGDGTVNILINSLIELNMDIPIGVIPAGTANDFASHIGMPHDVIEACRRILDSRPKKIDIGKVNDRYFINIASMGLFTDVSQKTDQSLKNILGKMAYFLKGIQEIPNFKKIPVRLRSREFSYEGDAYIVLVFNGNSAGSMDIAYNADLSDGMLDVIILNPETLLDVFPLFMKLVMKKNLADTEGITYFQTAELTLETDMEDLTTDVDGEHGPELPLRISCIKDGLNILGIVDK